ncbi:uncharacterized protein LOC117106683, partial [Anneissia japonica]|uniref:uncharacterized protein LOC117106683 n=1 Tax=Anneissia japonica TaxID=1529436 RepID=UPI001425B187
MKRCHVTLTKIGYTSDLNSTSNLLRIQELLPMYLKTSWAKKAHSILYGNESREPGFKDLLEFLEHQAEISCTMFGRNVSKSHVSSTCSKPANKVSVRTNNVSSNPLKCYVCDGNHRVYACSSLAENSYDQKVQLVKLKRLCFRCLAPGHVAAKCTKKWTCKKCGSGKHHEAVHPPPRSEASPDQQITSNCTSSGGRVYLRILPVVVTTYTGIQVSTLALLDQGSDASLCSESLRKQLGVRGERIKYKSTTINGDIDRVGFKFELTVKGKYEDQVMPVDFLSVPKIPASADSRPRVNDLGKWSHLNNLPWEDYEFDEVGLMIGSDAPQAFWVLEERKSKRKGNSKDPYAVKTLLGWSVMGPGGPGRRTVTSHHIQVSNQRLLEEVQMSWAIENSGLCEEQDSVEDIRARKIMESTIGLTGDGHYEMGLLWKYDNHDLPYNKSMAESRLTSLKRRLSTNDETRMKYTKVIQGYIENGYAEPVTDGETKSGNIWYLPHHPVIHPLKNKVRVVYDCAAKFRGTSLNDMLLKGPDLMNDLLGVLLRFRQCRIAIVSDIEAMFHQVRMIKSDRDVLRFLWWEGGDLSKLPKEYRMCVHLFGATSSPSCAGKALKQTADDNEVSNNDEIGRRATEIIRNSFYVDDCLSSVENAELAIQLVKRLVEILDKGGFRLTKWLSNDRSVLDSIEKSERAPSVPISLDELPTERTLGVCWNAEEDQFTFQTSLRE